MRIKHKTTEKKKGNKATQNKVRQKSRKRHKRTEKKQQKIKY
jgi:hypothetical protein